jgi:hypothetical protein
MVFPRAAFFCARMRAKRYVLTFYEQTRVRKTLPPMTPGFNK